MSITPITIFSIDHFLIDVLYLTHLTEDTTVLQDMIMDIIEVIMHKATATDIEMLITILKDLRAA